MVTPLSITFVNGQTCSAEQLNALVGTINSLISENNSINALLETISKSELLVVASKASLQTFVGNGQLNTITGWTTSLNKGSIFNASTGIATVASTGTYTIVGKTLYSADNATAPRSKLSIFAGGQQAGLSEDTVFQESNSLIQNYRRNHDVSATLNLNASSTILLSAQVWGATQARIFADFNTVIKIYREIS
jgi:hypothetical protein